MGTAAFEAKASEVQYLGNYTISQSEIADTSTSPAAPLRFRIDTDNLSTVKSSLVENAVLTENIQLAKYKNKFPHQCPSYAGPKMWGFEIPYLID